MLITVFIEHANEKVRVYQASGVAFIASLNVCQSTYVLYCIHNKHQIADRGVFRGERTGVRLLSLANEGLYTYRVAYV